MKIDEPDTRAGSPESPLHTLRRGAPIVIVTTLACVAITIALSLGQERRYSASSQVFVTQSTDTAIAGVNILSTTPERVIATQAEAARVPAVLNRAVDKINDQEIDPDELYANSVVIPDPATDVLTFEVTWDDAELARRLTNAYAKAYTEYRREVETGSLQRAQEEIQAQIAQVTATTTGIAPEPSGDATEPSGDSTQATATVPTEATATVPDEAASSPVVAGLLEEAQRLRTLELAKGTSTTPGRPATDASQVQPRPVRNALLGGLLGFILGVALVFVRDALNTRLRSAAEIEQRLGMPLIGRVPRPPKRLADKSRLVSLHEPQSPDAEAYRMLATNIELLNMDRGASSFLITSALHAEGKSTTAANLAVSFARRGMDVALVEADVRRPIVRKFFDLDHDLPGLAEAALRELSPDEALATIELDLAPEAEGPSLSGGQAGRLGVLPGDPGPPSPPDFLKSPAVRALFARLEESCDMLLVDTPPVLYVSDALGLALNADIDCVIAAARLNVLRRQSADELRRTLDGVPAVKLGFFATGGKTRASDYGGYGYYGNGAGRKLTIPAPAPNEPAGS